MAEYDKEIDPEADENGLARDAEDELSVRSSQENLLRNTIGQYHDYNDIFEQLKSLSIKKLTQEQRKSLGRLLDCKQPLGGDYEGLAGHLFPGLNQYHLALLEKERSPTVFLLKTYEKENPQANFFRLVEISLEMKRLDVIKELLEDAKGHLGKLGNIKEFLDAVKKDLFQKDDTISITSVELSKSHLSLVSSRTFPSSCSLSSVETFNAPIEVPLKEGIPLDKEKNHPQLGSNLSLFSNSKKKTKGQENKIQVFIVSSSDEKDKVLRLVKWFRKKGIDAKSIETNKIDYEECPSRYLKNQLDNSHNVLIVCSSKLKSIVDEKGGQTPSKGDAQVIKYVFQYLNNEIFNNISTRSKYIPLLPSKYSAMMKGNFIPTPLSPPEAYFFESKGSRSDLLRRILKEEKYKMPPIGNRPVIRQCFITGELLDVSC